MSRCQISALTTRLSNTRKILRSFATSANGKILALGIRYEVLESDCIGEVQKDKTFANLHVINNSDVPIICMGLKDAVVVAGTDGILVSDKVASSYIKPFVENLDKQIRFKEKS